MKYLLLIALVTSCLLQQQPVSAQNAYYRNNQFLLDRAKTNLRSHCQAFESSKPPGGGQLKADKKLISFLNQFYHSTAPAADIIKTMGGFTDRKHPITTMPLGGCTKYEALLSSDGILQAAIAFTEFNNEVVFKRIYFTTRHCMQCISPAQPLIDSLDINYLDVYCLPLIDFPLTLETGVHRFSTDATVYAQVKLDYPDGYKLIPADSTDLNHVVWYGNDTYSTEAADPIFINIASNHNTYLLYRLLYSPNHVAAVSALEAITCLEAKGIAKLPAYVIAKMDALRNAPVPLQYSSLGVRKRANNYNELAVTKEQILSRYDKVF
ncbi:MAG TPA: hypothetical protein VL307_01245 [Chitinophagaceae bacterium]|nr:hypothetical protein [Chitinophagaceae bacterium]